MNAIKEKIFLACSLLLLINLSGCGYTSRSLLAEKYKTIYIPQFANQIDITKEADTANKYKLYRPLLEQDVTQAVIDRFLFDGTLKPGKAQGTDLTLEGALVEFRLDPLRYTNLEDVEEYRVNIVVNLKLTDNKENKILWQENYFTGDSTYFTTGPAAKSEDTAISDAINDLTRRIVERTVEQW